MDLTEAIAAKSDQLNADDLFGGPVTVTIESVTEGNAEQRVNVHLVEFPGRPYRPGKSMSRVLAAAWGIDTTPYPGRRLTLYRDPHVKWGGQEVGGIRISHMSDIDRPLKLALTETRGKKVPFTVEPLTDDAPVPTGVTAEQVAACTDQGELRDMWQHADARMRKVIEARVAQLHEGTA